MFCPKCGTSVPDGSKFCETCGNNMQLAEQENQAQPETQEATPQYEPPKPVQPEPPKPVPQPVYQPQPQPSAYQPQPNYQTRPQPAPVYQNNGAGTDPREKVYGVGGWLGSMVVLCIPIVGIVMMFVWIFSSKVNKNKKNFAIAALILTVIGIVLSIILSASIIAFVNDLLNQMGGMDWDFGGF